MEQIITFSFHVYELVAAVLLGGIALGVLLAVAFHKRSHIRDLINEKL